MDELAMYVKYIEDGEPVAYAFGPEWVSMALYMDDMGADTEEAAVLEWYFKIFKRRGTDRGYVPTTRDADVEAWMAEHPGNETAAILDWYHRVWGRRIPIDEERKSDESDREDPASEDNSADR